MCVEDTGTIVYYSLNNIYASTNDKSVDMKDSFHESFNKTKRYYPKHDGHVAIGDAKAQ